VNDILGLDIFSSGHLLLLL